MTSKAQETNKKSDLKKLNILYFSKLHQESKKTTHRWHKILSNHILDEGLVPRIGRVFLQLTNKNINNPILKWAKDLNRHFFKIY